MSKTKAILSSTALALGLFSATQSVGATVIGGSDILSPSAATTIENWLVNDTSLSYSGSLGFTNIFDKSDGDTSLDFHAAADGQGPTFFVAEATDSRNGQTHIIGGYNPQSWASTNSYHYTSGSADRTAFIFNLTTGLRFDQETNTNSGKYQTYNSSTYGPTFGGGHDIVINATLTAGYANSYSYCPDPLQDCAAHLGSTNIMGLLKTGNTVSYGAIEVFTIGPTPAPAPVPLPAGLPLLLGALAGLGVIGRRNTKSHAS